MQDPASLIAYLQQQLAAEHAGRVSAELALRAAVNQHRFGDDGAGYSLIPIGFMDSPFMQRRGAPRQGALAPDSRAALLVSPSVSMDAFEGITGYSHVFVVFLFHENTNAVKDAAIKQSGSGKADTDRPPSHDPWAAAGRHFSARIAAPGLFGKRVGVFATRSPHRPNAIGLSLVRLEGVDVLGRRLMLGGCDLIAGTPVVDIKPACPYDCAPCIGRLWGIGEPSTCTAEEQRIERHRQHDANACSDHCRAPVLFTGVADASTTGPCGLVCTSTAIEMPLGDATATAAAAAATATSSSTIVIGPPADLLSFRDADAVANNTASRLSVSPHCVAESTPSDSIVALDWLSGVSPIAPGSALNDSCNAAVTRSFKYSCPTWVEGPLRSLGAAPRSEVRCRTVTNFDNYNNYPSDRRCAGSSGETAALSSLATPSAVPPPNTSSTEPAPLRVFIRHSAREAAAAAVTAGQCRFYGEYHAPAAPTGVDSIGSPVPAAASTSSSKHTNSRNHARNGSSNGVFLSSTTASAAFSRRGDSTSSATPAFLLSETDALLRCLAQILRLDIRSVFRGRGKGATVCPSRPPSHPAPPLPEQQQRQQGQGLQRAQGADEERGRSESEHEDIPQPQQEQRETVAKEGHVEAADSYETDADVNLAAIAQSALREDHSSVDHCTDDSVTSATVALSHAPSITTGTLLIPNAHYTGASVGAAAFSSVTPIAVVLAVAHSKRSQQQLLQQSSACNSAGAQQQRQHLRLQSAAGHGGYAAAAAPLDEVAVADSSAAPHPVDVRLPAISSPHPVSDITPPLPPAAQSEYGTPAVAVPLSAVECVVPAASVAAAPSPGVQWYELCYDTLYIRFTVRDVPVDADAAAAARAAKGEEVADRPVVVIESVVVRPNAASTGERGASM